VVSRYGMTARQHRMAGFFALLFLATGVVLALMAGLLFTGFMKSMMAVFAAVMVVLALVWSWLWVTDGRR
jgi:hypothetical protein